MANPRANPGSKKTTTTPTIETTPGIGTIDNAFIWQQLNDISKSLGRIESSIETLTLRVTKVEEKVSESSNKLNKIIWISTGAGAVVAGLVSAIGIYLKLSA